MSPALIARFPGIRNFAGGKVARSLHFIGLMTLVLYTLVCHTVSLYTFPDDVSDMVLGSTPYVITRPLDRLLC